MGFLDGREDPELFVQDAPTVGSLFSSDEITYKIRHIYGSTVKVDGEKIEVALIDMEKARQRFSAGPWST